MPKASSVKASIESSTHLPSVINVPKSLVDSLQPTCAYLMPDFAQCHGESFLYDLRSDNQYHTAFHSHGTPASKAILRDKMSPEQFLEHTEHLPKYTGRLLGRKGGFCPDHERAAETELAGRSISSPVYLTQYEVEECRHRDGGSTSKTTCPVFLPTDVATVPMQTGGKRRCSVWEVFEAEGALYRKSRGRGDGAEVALVLSSNGERTGTSTFYDLNLKHAHDITDEEYRSTGLKYYTTLNEDPGFALQQLQGLFGSYCRLIRDMASTVDRLGKVLSDENIRTRTNPNRKRRTLDWTRMHLGDDLIFHYEPEVPHVSKDGTLPLVTRYTLTDNSLPVLQYSTTSPEEPLFALKQLQSIFRTLRGLQDADFQLLQAQLVGDLQSESG